LPNGEKPNLTQDLENPSKKLLPAVKIVREMQTQSGHYDIPGDDGYNAALNLTKFSINISKDKESSTINSLGTTERGRKVMNRETSPKRVQMKINLPEIDLSKLQDHG